MAVCNWSKRGFTYEANKRYRISFMLEYQKGSGNYDFGFQSPFNTASINNDYTLKVNGITLARAGISPVWLSRAVLPYYDNLGRGSYLIELEFSFNTDVVSDTSYISIVASSNGYSYVWDPSCEEITQ